MRLLSQQMLRSAEQMTLRVVERTRLSEKGVSRDT